MKMHTAILSVAALAAISCSEAIHETNPEDTTKWGLVWIEDFDGQEIDWSVWSRQPEGTSDADRHMCDRADLAYVQDGSLVLRGIKNDGKDPAEKRDYLTGGLISQGKKSFLNAKFEIRAKFTYAQGFWPALWLLPDSDLYLQNGGSWEDQGEMDIMEHFSLSTSIRQTAHNRYSISYNSKDPMNSALFEVKKGEWNVYGVEVYEDRLVFYTNGTKVLTYPKREGLKGQWPYNDYPFYIILSAQIGGAAAGDPDPAQYPATMWVDWIKVYEKI